MGIHNPIEVRDLGDSLKSLADRYDEFARDQFGASESDSRFYIQEIKKGSIVVELVAASVGLMDSALILRQFHALLKTNTAAYIKGKLPKRHKPESARDYVNLVRAVANADADNSNISFAFREKTANGDEAAFVITKGEASDLTTQVFASQETPKLEQVENIDESAPRRELMRLYQHNLDPTAGDKKRTYHKAIIARYGKAP